MLVGLGGNNGTTLMGGILANKQLRFAFLFWCRRSPPRLRPAALTPPTPPPPPPPKKTHPCP